MWHAEITNDPKNEYRLYIELLDDDVFRGRVELNEAGEPSIIVYPTDIRICIPGNWLGDIIKGAREDLSNSK